MLAAAEVTSDRFATPRGVWIQSAPLPGATDCLIVLDAALYIERVRAPEIVSRSQAEGRLTNVNCIYISSVDGAARHVDLTCNRDFNRFLTTDLRPWIEQQVGHHDRYALCGLSLSGLAALFAATEHPNLFSGAVSQSPSAWWNEEWLSKSIASMQRLEGRYWISVGDQETAEHVSHPPSGLWQESSQLLSCRRLAAQLRERQPDLHYQEYAGGHDPQCWAKELARALYWLMG
jgi:enterochelin esterase-like enzyme